MFRWEQHCRCLVCISAWATLSLVGVDKHQNPQDQLEKLGANMPDEARMQLGNPFLIGVWSLALLTFGAAIGARWGHTMHNVICMIVIGALLMVIHDLVTGVVIFGMSMAWARRVIRNRSEVAVGIDVATVTSDSPESSGR
jgi:fatty acid desaturase